MKRGQWQPPEERRTVRSHHGSLKRMNGSDGRRGGSPLEVKSCRKDSRFRVNEDNHRRMVREKGTYIFVAAGKSKEVSAKRVSKMLGRGKWFKDRAYPHKFLLKDKIFGGE